MPPFSGLSSDVTLSNINMARALVRLTLAVAVATGTDTAIPWVTEVYDTDGLWDAGNPTRLTVPTGFTLARLSSTSQWATNAGGQRYIWYRKNGVATVNPCAVSQTVNAAFVINMPMVSSFIDVAAGDYFELIAFQNTGGNLNYNGGAAGSYFAMELWG